MANVDFVFFDAGGGHRSAALALKAVCEEQGRPWTVRLINLQELLEPIDVFKKATGIRLEDLYNQMLAKGWTLGAGPLLFGMQKILWMLHGAQVRVLAQHWAKTSPELVVSLVPNFNRAMFQALQRGSPASGYATVITDIADYPPHFWMERQDQYMICGSEKAFEQACAMGYKPEKVFQTSGMVLRPAFYEKFPAELGGERGKERRRIGLEADRPTGLLLFGGQGSPAMVKILKELQACRSELQVIAMCGRNRRLAARLAALKLRFPLHVVEFTQEVPRYMWLSDFLIGKAGPGSISEALAMGLPVIIERNRWTLPQERYNADWVRQTRTGLVISSFHEIGAAVDELLAPENFGLFRSNAAAIRNRAVFEIPDIIAGILARQKQKASIMQGHAS